MRTKLLEQLLHDRAAKRPVVLATRLKSGDQELIYPDESDAASPIDRAAAATLREDKGQIIEDPVGGGEVFLNPFNPPLRMFIVGAVHIAQPLARMAALSGYDVTVVDPRRAFATQERFPGVHLIPEWPDDAMQTLAPDSRTAIITLTHDPKIDDPALSTALKSAAFYVGALGSKKTHAARLERLRREGFGEAALTRIHGPVGLAIGAKSPPEIAVAILAEVTEVLRKGPPARQEAAE